MFETGHSRIPVYGDTLDDIIGIVHIIDVTKSLVKGKNKLKVENLIGNKPKFVSPSMRVLDLLSDMQKNKIHIAMVVDEYGGVDGLVTIEDLLEEIVGDIEDEYDIETNPEIVVQSRNVVIADAKAEIRHIEEKTGWNIHENVDKDEEEDVDTLGGLVFLMIQRIPQRGEVIEGNNGMRFRILDVDSRRIKKVMIVANNETENKINNKKNS
jgi:CBS domain containing-hemolysin-like protein